jgi:hypothetical protein
VAFLDALCVRELAMLGLLHPDLLVFRDPSPEAKLSVAACGMEDLVPFRESGEEPCRWAVAGQPRSHRSPRDVRLRCASGRE